METHAQRQTVEPGNKERPRNGQRDCNLQFLVVAGCLFLAGCVTLDFHQPEWFDLDGPPKGEVAQLMVLWADGADVRPDPMRGGLPTPGLAGRVFLFGKDLGEPLGADGSLVVYLYDDMQRPSPQPVPREVWNIDAANLERVLKKDGLGWGYNLWLPWSNYRPEISKVSLVVRYQPKKGPHAWSGTNVLAVGGKPGTKGGSRAEVRTNQPQARRANPVNPVSFPVRN